MPPSRIIPPPVLPPVPLSRSDWALNDFQRIMWFASMLGDRRQRHETPRWARRVLASSSSKPTCAVCGIALTLDNMTLSPVIAPRVGGHRVGRMLLWLCRPCERTRAARPDIVSWPEARADKKRWAAIAAFRMEALPYCANHAIRHPWRTKPPVLRAMRERWLNPRSSVFIACRDQFDNGEAAPAPQPFDGWIFWPVGRPPSGLVRLILGRAGWTPWPTPLPGWEVGTIAGPRVRNTLWSLIDANTWLRRVALADAPRAQPKPEPPPAFDPTVWDHRLAVAHDADWRDGRLIWGPRVIEAEAASAAALADHAAAVMTAATHEAEWRHWPPAGFERGADDDWWHTHWTVGQCLRRRPTPPPPRRGRFAPRRPGARPRPRRRSAGGGAG